MPFGFEQEDTAFGPYDVFEADILPEPGPFLLDCDVLVGRNHVAFHRLTRRLFEERGVYDGTFGYNLARLNIDRQHPDAGFRYAEQSDAVLRAEFTPTTAFCPQADALVVGAYRAWNGRPNTHEYDRVRVRVTPSHRQSETMNERLATLEDSAELH